MTFRLSATDNLGLIIFDCDGVLTDSEPLSVRCFTRALNNGGIPISEEEVSTRFTGHPDVVACEMLRQDYPDKDYAAILEDLNVIQYKAFREELTLIPGVEALVRGLDLPITVASNSSMERLEASLCLFGMARCFGPHIYSADMVPRPKPAPDLVELCLAQTGVPASRAVMIDDNPQGIHAALGAGVRPIGFIGPSEHRPGHEAALWQAGAWRVARGMDELALCLIDLAAGKTD